MNNLHVEKMLLGEIIKLVHEVLKQKEVPEDLRIKLVQWREDALNVIPEAVEWE